MISIISDPNQLYSPDNQILLDKVSQYPQVYQHILTSLQNQQDLTIVVRHATILQWLKNMSMRYPQGSFVIETLDARGALKKLWKIDLPVNVTNEEIIQTGLLSRDLLPQTGFSFEDTLLAHFYAPIFTAKTFPFTQLNSLLDKPILEKQQIQRSMPLLARTLHSRLEEWKGKAHSSEQRQLVELYIADPAGIKGKFKQYRVLHSYPAIGDALLGNAYYLFAGLRLQLQDLKVEELQIPETVVQITYYLNNQQPQNADELSALLERVSGLISIEFEIIEKYLLAHPEWVTTGLVDQIENKFNNLSRSLIRRLAELRGLICPLKPMFPESNWDVERMLAWATESYLPYQAWCDVQEQFDQELYFIGDRFSEWLINHWADIHANSKRMVFNILPNKAIELKQAGRFNLVIVVDNLGWSFSEILRDLFQERGYFFASAEPYLSMLPSETEISKKCLLAGAVGYQAIDDKTYKGILEKGWVPYFNDQGSRYISDIGRLNKLDTLEASTLVVNYLAVDKAFHQSADEIGMSHRDHIHHLLAKLVENTIAFIEKHGLQEIVRIHVVSDHGSTRIPAGVQNDLDPGFFKSSGFETPSHRFVQVSNERFIGLAENLKLDCFFLPANDFLNPKNVLCARRANRFSPTDQKYYVHGGLLPEEVIVPSMVFEPVTSPLQELTVLLKRNEFRYRMETIELDIGNPNETAVEQIVVSVLNSNIESEPSILAVLNAKKNTSIKIKSRFKLTSITEDQTSLQLRFRFRARGEQHTFDKQFVISMKKIVEEKSTSVFDD